MKEQWNMVFYYRLAKEKAEKHGFEINQGREYSIEILANKPPYVIGCAITTMNTFKEASAWLDGYEQHAFELKNISSEQK